MNTPHHRPLAMNSPNTRGAFSLIEMMIAIVILGLGMVMVGTMFPVAWTRARQLTDESNMGPAVSAAHQLVSRVARVDGRRSDGATFAGDLFYLRAADWTVQANRGLVLAMPPGLVAAHSDTRVHALHMENIGVSPRSRVWEAPYAIEPISWRGVDPDNVTPELVSLTFLSPQVKLEQRLFPPIRDRKTTTFAAADDASWDELFDSRRHAWAVFHRLRRPIGYTISEANIEDQFDGTYAPNIGDVKAYQVTNQVREFDLYYVLLRRPQPTNRYARQNPASAPKPADPPSPNVPTALPPDEDVFLPVPWRVQLSFNGPYAGQVINGEVVQATGLPSEVEVNSAEDPTSPMLVDFFAPGTYFIDEVTGNFFRVIKQRITDDDGNRAVLTLDRELSMQDIDWPEFADPLCTGCTASQIDDIERLRTVWVFPPSVQSARNSNGSLQFVGIPPAIGIELRSLTLSPSE